MKLPVHLVSMAAAVALLGCSAVGEGTAPVSAAIQPRGGLEGATSARVYQCLPSSLSFIVSFSDGQKGDFASRSTFTSSDPAVVQVSNGEIAVPESTTGQVYSRGVLIPKATGTATVTASYLNFKSSITISVGTLDNLRVVPSAAYLAPNTLQDLAVLGDLDGQATALDNSVVWSITNPNTAIATITSDTGTLSGVGTGSGLVAQAHIPGCATNATASVEVSPLQSLALTREFGSETRLVVGTTEAITATGTLANGQTQDLSTQTTYTSSNTSLLGFSLINLAAALAAGDPVNVTGTVGSTGITSPALSFTPVTDTLQSVAVSPTSANVKAGYSQQFVATGSYASGLTQPITRHVGWTLNDYTLGGILTSTSSGLNTGSGLFTAASTAGGKSVTVTATNTNATVTSTANATVNIQ